MVPAAGDGEGGAAPCRDPREPGCLPPLKAAAPARGSSPGSGHLPLPAPSGKGGASPDTHPSRGLSGALPTPV